MFKAKSFLRCTQCRKVENQCFRIIFLYPGSRTSLLLIQLTSTDSHQQSDKNDDQLPLLWLIREVNHLPVKYQTSEWMLTLRADVTAASVVSHKEKGKTQRSRLMSWLKTFWSFPLCSMKLKLTLEYFYRRNWEPSADVWVSCESRHNNTRLLL